MPHYDFIKVYEEDDEVIVNGCTATTEDTVEIFRPATLRNITRAYDLALKLAKEHGCTWSTNT